MPQRPIHFCGASGAPVVVRSGRADEDSTQIHPQRATKEEGEICQAVMNQTAVTRPQAQAVAASDRASERAPHAHLKHLRAPAPLPARGPPAQEALARPSAPIQPNLPMCASSATAHPITSPSTALPTELHVPPTWRRLRATPHGSGRPVLVPTLIRHRVQLEPHAFLTATSSASRLARPNLSLRGTRPAVLVSQHIGRAFFL